MVCLGLGLELLEEGKRPGLQIEAFQVHGSGARVRRLDENPPVGLHRVEQYHGRRITIDVPQRTADSTNGKESKFGYDYPGTIGASTCRKLNNAKHRHDS